MSIKIDRIIFQEVNAEKRGHPFKRAFDLLFSLCALLLLSPIYLIIAIAIKVCSPGPAFYSQYRLGKGGILFKCYKFRTMHTDADHLLTHILQHDQALAREWQSRQKLTLDPRVFALGFFLRKFSLDELPQFYNVLKGDLSVVGPRPYMVSQLEKLGIRAEAILSIKPGVTGIWQTSGRSSTSFERRISLDSEYVTKSSLWLDILLIAKTFKVIFKNKDAH